MDWLTQNWVWLLVLAAFVGMHLFGHGGHEGHGGRGGHGGCCGGDEQRGPAEQEGQDTDRPQGHRH